MNTLKKITLITLVLLLGACGQNNANLEKPEPAILSDDAMGHYDKMIVVGHIGPRAQVFLAGDDVPLWFTQVRDGLAYLKSDEKTAEILAIYVNDVGAAPSWSDMGVGNWIDAKSAFYVFESDAVGGMRSPELVPFSDKEKAQEFIDTRGGRIINFTDITAEMVLVPDFSMLMEDGKMKMKMDGETGMDSNMNMETNTDMQPTQEGVNQ
ncbi:MAG: nitrous oxide reductase accessory protein NosL [Devosiaceae bacterium]|nr:nitrous oxide reductase accessory protein NosL [Devosiaceae bacterium]